MFVYNMKTVLSILRAGSVIGMFPRTIKVRRIMKNSLHGAHSFVRTPASKEMPGILWNPKVHYLIHTSPPLVPNLSPINPVHDLPSYFFNIYFNNICQSTSRSSE
jgi:hypothetical protein